MQSVYAIQCQHPKFFPRNSDTLSESQTAADTIGADDASDTGVALPIAELQEYMPRDLEDVLKLSLFAVSGALDKLTSVVSRTTNAVQSSTPHILLADNLLYINETLSLIGNQFADTMGVMGVTLRNSELC